MKIIRSLWSRYKEEVRHWKCEKSSLIQGVLLGVFISWLFYNRVWLVLFMTPLLFPWMKWEREKKRQKKNQIVQKEFREMMLSISNSLSVGYSLENALLTAKDDLKLYQGGKESVLLKELELLTISLKVNEPVEKLLFQMAEKISLEEMKQFAEITAIVRKNGGNLIEIIGKTVEHLSESMQLKEEIQTMTAAKKMEKNIMSVMPYFIVLYVRMTNSGYFTVLYETIVGNIISTAALIFLIIANLWAERVVTIEI